MTAKLCITWWVIDLGWNPIQILSSELDMINKIPCFSKCTWFKIKEQNTALIIDDQNVNPAPPPLPDFHFMMDYGGTGSIHNVWRAWGKRGGPMQGRQCVKLVHGLRVVRVVGVFVVSKASRAFCLPPSDLVLPFLLDIWTFWAQRWK